MILSPQTDLVLLGQNKKKIEIEREKEKSLLSPLSSNQKYHKPSLKPSHLRIIAWRINTN